MNKLHIYITFVIIGYTAGAPPENELREIITIVEDNPGFVSRDEQQKSDQRKIIFEIIQTKDAAHIKNALHIDEIADDDMDLAETHIFRPLFRYRAQLEKRERLRQSRS
ncbi:hypothetical protein Bhyg_07952 [Pseudolycoriella hygida]|uniref:Uncharacterized protein n=1 Tax=Pseudolycoriella hygida TaxID=35572 RepID=A0A9Q0N4Y7_9DIPT|nr:hypothetical protein Bhyg_07952 [Pseudolycoriella hygida]